MKPIKSAYSDIMINDQTAVVSIIAYRTGWHFGGHTHLAFEYPDAQGFSGTAYRHVVFHLVALGGGYNQMCTGTSATVLKQVPVGRGRYGFVGGAGALQKGKQRARKAGRTVTKEEEVNFQLHPINNWERNLPNDDSWTTTKYRCQSVSIPPSIAKKGRMLCRKLAKGETTEGVETKKFHKMTPSKGTNCVRFAMQILQKINVRSDWVFKFHAKFSPPEAIKRGTLRYIAK